MSLDQSKFVAVYSNDVHLVESVEGDSFLCYEKTDQSVEYNLKSSTSDVQWLAESDAVIYDLDLAAGDEASIIEDILHLKLSSRFKPLILVGEKDLLKHLMASDKIKPHVAKSIAKPVNQTRLRFVVDALIAKKMVMMPPVKEKQSAFKLVALGSVATACLGASLAFVLLNNEDANASIDLAGAAQSFEQHAQTNTSSQVLVGKVSADVKRLSEQALDAMAEGRLAFPKNNSALHYYDQILAADLYNTEAYEGRKQVLAHLRESLPGLISSGEKKSATKVVDALISAEPFRDDNRDLLALLAPSKKPASSSLSSVKEKPVKDSVQESKVEQPKRIVASKLAPVPVVLASAKPVTNVKLQALKSLENSIQEPVVLESVGPRYPKRAVRNNIEGWVEVAYQVDAAGKPINVQVIKAQPEKVFDKSGIRAVEEWKFEPAVDSRTGQTVISERATTTFRFTLDT